ncbi:MAG: ferritin-like protein [Pyrinomonadaceae bacterium]
MAYDRRIVELLSLPRAGHDLEWLKESLQAAIKLEFATLPPYLAAYWSVKDEVSPVASSLREIFREEMLHMGLACNMLTALGGVPQLDTRDAVPVYPGPLPGGVNPELIVPLGGLTKDILAVFMKVEFPAGGPLAHEDGGDDEVPTIGDFYTAVQRAFDTLQPALSPDRQLEGPLGLRRLVTLDAVRDSITLIKRQGEGSEASPEDTGPSDLAHFYRFGEMFHGKRFQRDPATGEFNFDGPDLPFPEVFPMAVVPEGGYRGEDVTDEVARLLGQFDRDYTTMLGQLQTAWERGDRTALRAAVSTMLDLRDPAVSLMQIAIPGREATYGPCFRLVG